MVGYILGDICKVIIYCLVEMKQRGEKIFMFIFYDYMIVQIVDGVGIDVILVGDFVLNVMVGNVIIFFIIFDQMIYYGKFVVCGVKCVFVVVDLFFGIYQIFEYEVVINVIKVMKIMYVDVLKLEGGVEIIDVVKKIIVVGIFIMGYLGLML